MRWVGVLAVAVVATALAVATATAARRAEPGRFATPAELRWLRGFSRWARDHNRRIGRLSDVQARIRARSIAEEDAAEQLRDAAAALQGCGKRFERVGEPPTARVGRPAGLIARACADSDRAAQIMVDAVEQDDPKRLLEAGPPIAAAVGLTMRANELLLPGEIQPLARRGGAGVETSRVEPHYGRAATALAGKRVEVRCWSKPDWKLLMRELSALRGTSEALGGYTTIGGSRVNLSPDVCTLLGKIAYEGARERQGLVARGFAEAAVALAHEIQHARGVADEATADCFGVQRVADGLARLGVPRAYGRELGRLYWRHRGELDRRYRSPECREGGKLDLRPLAHAFP